VVVPAGAKVADHGKCAFMDTVSFLIQMRRLCRKMNMQKKDRSCNIWRVLYCAIDRFFSACLPLLTDADVRLFEALWLE
jgi:hypothetical protein